MTDKTNQTPLEKFQRLASARGEKAAKEFKLLGNLAASAYEIDPKLAQDIVNNLASKLEELKIRWKLIENPNKKTRKKSTNPGSSTTTAEPEVEEKAENPEDASELLASMADVD